MTETRLFDMTEGLVLDSATIARSVARASSSSSHARSFSAGEPTGSTQPWVLVAMQAHNDETAGARRSSTANRYWKYDANCC